MESADGSPLEMAEVPPLVQPAVAPLQLLAVVMGAGNELE